jgi:NAD(P) transhydrogenase subunit alpha
MTTVFVPQETRPGETRVAAIPETVKRLVKLGVTVTVEEGAGARSFFRDAEYAEAGAKLVPGTAESWAAADIVLKVQAPAQHPRLDRHEADLPREGALLVGFVWTALEPELARRLAGRKLSVLAMEAVPRTLSRAQKVDALSSQANLSGYKAALMAANALGRGMPMMTTAAGTLKPARVVVMGAGVAGLQAIATAKRLGALVEATDVRRAVKEQIESLGAKFIDVPLSDAEGKGGYARELTPEEQKKQQEIVREHLVMADAIIATALIPGRPAPKLVPAEVVEKMRPGSVVVDLAAPQGGNCALCQPGKTVVEHGVTIVGELNVPALLPYDASSLYARNILALLQDCLDKQGQLKLETKDEVVDAMLVIHQGEIRHAPTREAVEKLPKA